jgi:hypothetical protein
MPGFFRAATTVCAGGAIVGAGVLMMLPSAPEGALLAPPLFTTVRVSDLPPAPCKQQIWLNADRACQTWTTPKRQVEKALSATAETAKDGVRSENVTIVEQTPMSVANVPMPTPKPQVVMARNDSEAQITVTREAAALPQQELTPVITDVRLSVGETTAEAQARALRPAQDDTAKTVRVARSVGASSTIPVAAHSADGTRRVIMIRPTSRQDALYYAARRELAAVNPHLPN